jgi:16S rRNA G966 N2-methylase RsmD
MQPGDDSSLADFVARHGKPYDATADTYDRPAFAADIKEGKNDPIYYAHSYHTKVPPRAIIPYILHYTEPGDLILDPFCGSGMTGVAALMCSAPPVDLLEQFPDLRERIGERRTILNDLSPAACHIARNYCTPVNVEALRREFERIKAVVKDEFAWLYGTEHYEPAVGVYGLTQPEVLCRLKQLPAGVTLAPGVMELLQAEKTWEVVDRAEVEQRLGYPVERLSFSHRKDLPEDFSPANQKDWLVIPATVQYTIWSDVYRCQGMVTVEEPTDKISTTGKNIGKKIVRKRRVNRGCGQTIVLWEAVVDPESGEIREDIVCQNPTCQQKWGKTAIRRCGLIPVVSNYSFVGLRSGKRGIVPATVRTERPISDLERLHIRKIDEANLPDWCPTVPFDRQGPQYRRNALNARNIGDVRDFYTKRNLRALARLWSVASETPDQAISSTAKFAITAIILPMTRMYRYRPDRKGGILDKSLYIPSMSQEMNVGTAFNAKVVDVLRAAEARRGLKGDCVVICGGASDLPVDEATVDYIFADPPFGSNIYYSEVSFLWEAWFGRFMDRNQEAVVHRKNDGGTKRIPDYADAMAAAFRRMYRVLKPGRWATIEFNNSDGQVFEAIKAAVRGAGFEIHNMMFLDKEQKTFKQIKGVKGEEDVVGHDVIFNLQKPPVLRQSKVLPGPADDVIALLVEAVGEHLRTLPERMRLDARTYTDDHRTTPFLNTMLMNALIPRGVDVSQLNLPFIEQVCGRYFRKVEGRWYLRSEAVGGNNATLFRDTNVKDEPSAIAWLRNQMKERPLFLGEIQPLWMRAIALLPNEVSQRLDLERLLLDNFFRDPETNRWREPTEEERERMNDDRVLRVVHDAERFLSRSLRREPSDAEVCDWIDTLFRACKALEERDRETLSSLRGLTASEGYRLICGIFPSVLRERVSPALYSRASKQEGIASQRLQKSQAATRKRPSDAQPGLFDDR